MVPRRKILLSAGVSAIVGVSGCLWTDSAPDTSPPSAADCPDEPRVPAVETRPDEGAVPAIPSRPESLTERSVVEYVDAYEYAFAYRRNTKLGPLRAFFLDGAAEPVWVGDDGVHCEFHEVVPHGRYVGDDGEVYTFDMGRYAAAYLVTDEAVWRAESEPANRTRMPDPPDPRGDGEVLECF